MHVSPVGPASALEGGHEARVATMLQHCRIVFVELSLRLTRVQRMLQANTHDLGKIGGNRPFSIHKEVMDLSRYFDEESRQDHGCGGGRRTMSIARGWQLRACNFSEVAPADIGAGLILDVRARGQS